MSRWFRFYDEALDDPKVQRLSPHLFRAWVNLLCLASKAEGVLPSIADIAFRLRMSENDARAAVDDLILAELLDIGPDGRLCPHNWSGRQCASDTSKERTRKWREKKGKPRGGNGRDVTGDVTVTGGDENGDGLDPDQRREEIEKKEVRSEHSAREPDVDEPRSVKALVQDGLGRGGVVSVEARRKVAASLAIGDADPLVRLYEAWPRSRAAKDPDALFIAVAPRLYRDAAPEVRQACQSLGVAPPEPITRPTARASSALIASLNRGTRHVATAH